MSSSEEESFKEKYENIKWVVNRLQRDLHAEQLRNKGVETLSACLEEQRARVQELQEKSKKQERGIAVLQSRLEKQGQNASLTLEDGEILRPGSSRSLLESLMAENSRLKRNQKYLNVDPERMEQALEENRKFKTQVDQLQAHIKTLTEKLEKAESQLRASDSDKDKRILQLEDSTAALRRSKDTQSVLCNSLSEETVSLRQQLKETMKQMQDTMHRLETDDVANQQAAKQSSSSGNSEQQVSLLKAQVEELQQEVEVREQKLQKVADMNSRWQTYNKQRDLHVHELSEKLAQAQAPKSTSDVEQMQASTRQLQQKVRSLEQIRQQLEEENRQLKSRIEALQLSTLDQEKINLYEAQIKVITEDFKQERDDRAREHEKAERLERELAEVKSELESLQRHNLQTYADRRQKSLENYEQQYYQNMYGSSTTAATRDSSSRHRNIGQQQAAFVPRRGIRYSCDSGHHIDDDEEEEEEEEEGRSEDVVDTPTDDVLQCPKCLKTFPTNQHGDLLEHLEKC